MRRLSVGFVILLLLAVVPLSSSAEKLPVILHGGIGFGKMIEDNAPDGSIGIGVGVIYPLADMPIAIGADIGYQILGKESGSETLEGVGSVSYDWTFSTIPVTGQVYYLIPASDQATVYVDGGLGLYNWRIKAEVSGNAGPYVATGSTTDSETDFGFNGGGGFKFGNPDSQIGFGLDAKLHIVMTDSADGNDTSKVIQVAGRVFFQ